MNTSVQPIADQHLHSEPDVQLKAVRNEAHPKTLESEMLIQFGDCDPFSHLNNSKFIEYFMNAREHQLLKECHINLFDFARKQGLGWVVTKHQIAYLQPARVLETVNIQTTILAWKEKGVLVEMRMWDKEKTELKALLWAHFIHFDLKAQKVIAHSPEIDAIFKPFENPLDDKITFEQRVKHIRG